MLAIQPLAQPPSGLAFPNPSEVSGHAPIPSPDTCSLQPVVVESTEQHGDPLITTVDHGSLAESDPDARRFGDHLRKYAIDTLDDISSKYGLGEMIVSLKSTISTLVNEAESTVKDIRSHLPDGVHIGHIIDELQGRLENMAIPEKLQKEFPLPSEAPSHDDRERFSNAVFDTFIDEFDGALKKVVSSEEKREKIKESLRRVQPTVVNIAVTVGDLAEQHPVIAGLLPIAATALVVDVFVFRTFLRLVGFGPLGPIRGSLAAYAQRYLFGATVPAGSWFSFLQRAGMVPGWLGGLFGGLFGGLGKLSGWFKPIPRL